MKSAKHIEIQQRVELNRLIEWVGSKARLAEQLNVTRQAVQYWEKRGRIPATMAIEVERLTKGYFKKEELRPDVLTWVEQ